MEPRKILSLKKPLSLEEVAQRTLKSPVNPPKKLEIVIDHSQKDLRRKKPFKGVVQKKTCRQPLRMPRDEKTKAALLWLVRQYPKAFSLTLPIPLKLAIEKDIFLRMKPNTISRQAIRNALKHYCYSNFYLKALSRSKYRYDLENKKASLISVEHKQYASQLLKKMIEKGAPSNNKKPHRPFKKASPSKGPASKRARPFWKKRLPG